jgi:predicted GIY-YIG superfamily endonuclease
MRYVGLTNDHKRRKEEHGNPKDFRVLRTFKTEKEAREWEKQMLGKGYKGDTGGKGWRYGYTFSKTR